MSKLDTFAFRYFVIASLLGHWELLGLFAIFSRAKNACWLGARFSFNVNWSLQFFSQDYNIGSHTTHIICVHYYS